MSSISYYESSVRRLKATSRLRGQTARYKLGSAGCCLPKYEVVKPQYVRNSLYKLVHMCQLLTTTSLTLQPQQPKLYHISHTKDRVVLWHESYMRA